MNTLLTLYFHDLLNSCVVSILACIFLTVMYIASLYVWRSNLSRDHPSTIKRRFFSASCMMLLAPFFCQSFFTERTRERGDAYLLMGLRFPGLIQASIYPLILTVILFLGPLTMQVLSGVWTLYKEPVYWVSNLQDLVWIRNNLMAPLSEEWVFRACMMPLILQCYEPQTAVFVGPLLFGIAHLHHMIELLKSGNEVKMALFISAFQITYTTIFGAYSSYLFVRTGHFVAPLFAHMFCNHMGFPNFFEISEYPMKQRMIIICNFVLGLVLWLFLLKPLTDPDIYSNRLYLET